MLEPVTDTISSKLLNYEIFNLLCGMNINVENPGLQLLPLEKITGETF